MNERINVSRLVKDLEEGGNVSDTVTVMAKTINSQADQIEALSKQAEEIVSIFSKSHPRIAWATCSIIGGEPIGNSEGILLSTESMGPAFYKVSKDDGAIQVLNSTRLAKLEVIED